MAISKNSGKEELKKDKLANVSSLKELLYLTDKIDITLAFKDTIVVNKNSTITVNYAASKEDEYKKTAEVIKGFEKFEKAEKNNKNFGKSFKKLIFNPLFFDIFF